MTAKTTQQEESLPIPEPKPTGPPVEPLKLKFQPNDPFGSQVSFDAQLGGWPKDAGHKGLEAAHEDIRGNFGKIAATYRRMMQNESLSPAQRMRAAAETCHKMMTSSLMRTDRRLQKATEQAEELTARLEKEHLSPPRDALEQLQFNEIRQHLREQGTEVFTSVFEAAKHGDALTTRALLTAPQILQPKGLSKEGREAIRRVYLLRVANEDALYLEGLEKAITAVQRAGGLLMDRLSTAIDFQSAERLAQAERDAAQLQKAASENLRDTKLELD